jgi:hypothetical protein
MAAATKKKRKEAYPWKAGASSGHITNLKQSILETFDIYGVGQLTGVCTIKNYESVIYGFRNKVLCLYKPLKKTNNKDGTSLLQNLSIIL